MQQPLQIPPDIRCTEKTFRRGEVMLDPCAENQFLYLLTSGEATVYYQTENGEILAIYAYHPVDFFGELELLSDRKLPTLVRARTDCRVTLVHRDEVLRWLKQDFSFTQLVLRRLCEKVVEGSNERMRLSLLTIRQRYLLAIRRHEEAGDLTKLTKAKLCEEVGAPLRSLNRVIAQCGGEVRYENRRFVPLPLGQPRAL